MSGSKQVIPTFIRHIDKHEEWELSPQLVSKWPFKERFDHIMQTTGEVYRHIAGRKTLHFDYAQGSYFIKLHSGVGWREIFNNLMIGKRPVLGAVDEYQALLRLPKLGIAVPKLMGFGQSGCNPATLHSFLITEDVSPAVSLEDMVATWQQNPPAWRVRQALIKEVARIARTLHQNGINHRDFYICHFMVKQPLTTPIQLILMDLHRAQMRSKTPLRWLVKDLGSLYYSTLKYPITKHDRLRFLAYYTGKSWREALSDDPALWQKVEKRARTLQAQLDN